MLYSDPQQILETEGSTSMRPLKASLFIVYCLLAVVLVGTAFSHVWRTSRDLSKDKIKAEVQQTLSPEDTTATAQPLEPEQSQS